MSPTEGLYFNSHEPTEKELRDAIEKYSSLGLTIQFTEVDMSIYPWEKNPRARRPGESDAYTPELEQKQTEQYKMVFRIFRDYKKVISGVTFWNVSDNTTWLDNYPVRGRKNYPLLFDANRQPKRAYWAVVKF
jgi:endo-1,4-beta-xylanase